MNRTNVAAYLFTAIFAIALHTGSCIKCYNCVSKVTDKCLNPSGTDLEPKECTPQLLHELSTSTKNLANGLASIFGLDIPSNANPVDVPMNCLKMESMVGSEKVTVRGCQLAPTQNLDFCKNAMESLNHNNDRVMHCSLCDTDSCNSSPVGATPVSLLIALLPAIGMCVLGYMHG